MKAGACLLVAVAVGLCPAMAAAAPQDRDLSEVRSRIRQVGADMQQLSAERTQQQDALEKLDRRAAELADALDALKLRIRELEQSLGAVRVRISITQKSILIEQHGLSGLVKSAYAMGSQSGLKGYLNLQDPSLSGRMQVYYDYIGKARLQKLLSIQQDFQALQQLGTQKDTETRLLQVAMDKKRQETEDLEALREQRKKLLAQINSAYHSKQGQMQQLVSDEKKLTALVASLQKNDDNAGKEPPVAVENEHNRPHQSSNEPDRPPIRPKVETESFQHKPFAELQGQLPWPVQGAISERFGNRRFETTWDGTVINAGEGAGIRAIAAGRVVYADWLRGYGLMMIVDHGQGYMSLYAYNQSLYKSVGDRVAAGEVLATVGRSGGRSQAALYFGIRKNGRPVNPEHWCRKSARD